MACSGPEARAYFAVHKTSMILKTKPTKPNSRAGGRRVSPPKIRSILVPVDFSRASERALDYAASLAGPFEAKLILLNVVEPFPAPDFTCSPMALDDDVIVAQAKEHLKKVQVRCGLDPKLVGKTLVRHGSPYAEITDAARTLKADLIVISTHGYTGLAHVFMGSTSERVVRHAPCPVLVVRATGRDFN